MLTVLSPEQNATGLCFLEYLLVIHYHFTANAIFTFHNFYIFSLQSSCTSIRPAQPIGRGHHVVRKTVLHCWWRHLKWENTF